VRELPHLKDVAGKVILVTAIIRKLLGGRGSAGPRWELPCSSDSLADVQRANCALHKTLLPLWPFGPCCPLERRGCNLSPTEWLDATGSTTWRRRRTKQKSNINKVVDAIRYAGY